MENKNSKKVWTEEERLELAAKIDAGLYDYINKLEKKTYTEGWPEDRWQEEMEKHPFFMMKAPEPGEELSPLMEGLQQLKFGEDYNTPEELANNYKEDGNFNYKHGKYRMAILSYTEGIQTKCQNQELMAQLYNNRAASQYMLKNYRSCLNDCKLALKLNPDYAKCLRRAAACCLHIKDYNQCKELSERLLTVCRNDKTATDLIIEALRSMKQSQRDKRKQKKAKKNVHAERKRILSAIKSRGINLVTARGEKLEKWEDLERPQNCELTEVYLDEDDKLLWPVIFALPEKETSFFINDFHEDTTIEEMLQGVLKEPPEWDTKHQYTADNLMVFSAAVKCSPLDPVDATKSLGDILAGEGFEVLYGTPTFWIFPKQLFQPEASLRLGELFSHIKQTLANKK